MKNKEAVSFKIFQISDGLILLGVIFAISFWSFESWLHVVFYEESFANSFLRPSVHDLILRAIVVFLLITLGVYAKIALLKIKKEKNKAEKINFDLDQIFNTMPDGLRIVDNNYNTLTFNEAFTGMCGFSKQDISDRKCFEVFPGDDCHTDLCPLRQIIEKKQKIIVNDVKKKCCLGKKIVDYTIAALPYKDLDGNIIGVIENFRDISDRKKIEEELIKSESKFKLIYKNLPVPTYLWQGENDDFVLVDYNDAAYDITKGKIVEFVGINAKRMYEDNKEIIRDFEECLKNKKAIHREMRYCLKTTGETKDFIIRYAFVDPDFVLTHTMDVTDTKKAAAVLEKSKIALEQAVNTKKRELEAAQSQLLKTEKLAALGKMASSIAHEIRNPLGVIKTAVYSISKKNDIKKGSIKRSLQNINTEINSMDRLVSDMLSFSKLPEISKKAIDVNKIINSTIRKNNLCVKKYKLKIIKKLNENLPVIKVDPQRLEEVFCNLFLNAAQAMADSVKKEIKIVTQRENDYVVVRISDTGCGIRKSDISRLGEAFFSTKTKGVGLGLYVSYNIIKKHNGKIEVKSKVGEGTDFIVRLPI